MRDELVNECEARVMRVRFDERIARERATRASSY